MRKIKIVVPTRNIANIGRCRSCHAPVICTGIAYRCSRCGKYFMVLTKNE